MAGLRHLSSAHRRWAFLLLAALLCVRALVPAGWMPVAGAHGVELALCDGAGPMPATMTMHGHGAVPAQHHHGVPDHPCDFAAASVAFTVTMPAVLPAMTPPRHQPSGVRLLVGVGSGLAAPPPPPTGPPAFA